MAGGEGKSLEETPTWAVAVVCFVLLAISIVIEHTIDLIGEWLAKKNKVVLKEALDKIKAELMLMGFISLLLTVGQSLISEICISKALAKTWHPCSKNGEENKHMKEKQNFTDSSGRRGLLSYYQGYRRSHGRVLAAVAYDKCAKKGKVPFVSAYGIHQLHIFIFVLALSHIVYCLVTLAFGKAKMREWRAWEIETRTTEYQAAHDPERFRFTRQTTFGRRHLSFWSQTPVLLWIVCFFRQFVGSVHKVDYLTLRHGFIIAHLEPRTHLNFNLLNYIERTLEKDFKVVVGISPPLWLFAVLFLLFNAQGLHSYLWLPFIPLIILLLVGTKLQVIITKLAVGIQERGEVVKGTPAVRPGDDLFWFNYPQLLLYLIHFVLFQNAFQLAFFAWSWYEFGLRTCFHKKPEDIVIRITMGVIIQILCSYVTLPHYALVMQMSSSMKETIFSERVAESIRGWYKSARHKRVKGNSNQGGSATQTGGTSPVHLLHSFRQDTAETSSRKSSIDPGMREAYPSHEISSDDTKIHEEERQHNNIQLTDFSFGHTSRVQTSARNNMV